MKESYPSDSDNSSSSPPSIAVIGGGPGAMFFCHSLELQKKELESKGQDTSHFPVVQCFERSAGPGGIWRSDRVYDAKSSESSINNTSYYEGHARSTGTKASPFIKEEKKTDDESDDETDDESVEDATTPNMYAGLWTNGPKEMYEMHDYTFQDHFGDVRMPIFLPRKHVLEYLLARVTKNCPNFFQHYFTFKTSVTNVRYVENKTDNPNNNKFRVELRDETAGAEQVQFFDKCVWAAGKNGIPSIPMKLRRLFEEGGFPGSIFHSSDTSTFKADVEGKNLLIIGGSYSAEDLALMAIKEGAKKVYCSCRNFLDVMTRVSRWPYDKVEIFSSSTIDHVEGSKVTLSGVVFDAEKYEYVANPDAPKIVLQEIDTVILSTGYNFQQNMLDKTLLDIFKDEEEIVPIRVPDDWNMKKNNFTEIILGEKVKDIRPDIIRQCEFYYHSKIMYRECFCLDNPNMIYLGEFGESPLISLDVFSWMIARVVTNQVAIPSREEVKADELQILIDCLNCPIMRYEMDWKYQKAIDDAVKKDENLAKSFSSLYEVSYTSMELLEFKLLGDTMNKFGYPVSYMNPDGKTLSAYGEAMKVASWNSRIYMNSLTYDTKNEDDGWRSFRDHPDLEKIKSYFTGTPAKLLPKPWVDLDVSDKLW